MIKQSEQQLKHTGRPVPLLLGLLCLLGMTGCQEDARQSGPLFTAVDPSSAGIDFQNTLTATNEFNIFTYRNFYNGGGVGIGDINNDGLPDIYLTANLLPNRLYLNKGNFTFEDITEKAGVAGRAAWSTGVSMVDINADGWLDIYVCNSGDVDGDNKQNEFFINRGDGTFDERAEAMGLADKGYSTHAAFFDYDKDGDLDVYLLNNSYQPIESFNLRNNVRPVRDSLGGDKLLRNDGGVFTDVSEEAGIYGSIIGFGLGVSVSDLDKDGWPDLYISNDFFERDYLYMNRGDGTFSEELEKQMRSISVSSMGSDVADITGDGYPEIFVTEMLPEEEERVKTKMLFENWDKYQYNLENGYYHQFTRNMLHRNNGKTGAKGITFSEVGRLAGVEATDWSWSALIADLDNDGHKDLFIANGIAQDLLDQDYLNYVANEGVSDMILTEAGIDFKKLLEMIPSTRIPNYAYSGTSRLHFDKKTAEWGLDTPSHSNGAAYGDLDNDGDLDLVVNNINMPPFLYRNESDGNPGETNYLKVVLRGIYDNPSSIGSKITLRHEGRTYYQEAAPNRGFQSTVDNRLNFGLGAVEKVDSLIVDWFYGGRTVLTDIPVNQTLVLDEGEAEPVPTNKPESKERSSLYFTALESIPGLNYTHTENNFVDFDRDQLLYQMKSNEGPKIARADVNGDGRADLFLGGAKDSPGRMYLQEEGGTFTSVNEALFKEDQASEDLESLFFDADGDGDLDLYVASGGNEHSSGSFALIDRLYLNDGRGSFTRSGQLLPAGRPESSAAVSCSDFDGDGDLDLFVGIRLKSGEIGIPQKGYLLRNDGRGGFSNVTREMAPELEGMGMITDALWTDYDGDGDEDLIVVGEWMPIRVFENRNGKLVDTTSESGLDSTSGWWKTIEAADLDGDGDMDLVAGNHGLNTRFSASPEKPVTCYINDFDRNGKVEQIICKYNGDRSYPIILRHDLVKQLPGLKKKYLRYDQYKSSTIDEIFSPETLEESVVHKVTMLQSVILLNDGKGRFQVRDLPVEAQISPVYAILLKDLDRDGIPDMLLGGNQYGVKPEEGRYDASYGLFLRGLGHGEYERVTASENGLLLEGEVRDFEVLEIGEENILVVARSNASNQYFKF